MGRTDPRRGEAFAPWETFPDPGLPDGLFLVHGALLAASGHNVQPWRFAADEDARSVEVWLDRERWTGPVDALRREQGISIGCAIENAVQTGGLRGLAVDVTVEPVGTRRETLEHVATLRWSPGESERWGELLTERRTDRSRFAEGLQEADLDAFRALLGADVGLEVPDRERCAAETVRATAAIVEDTAMNEASHAWWRQTQEDIETHRDGLTLDAQARSGLTRFLGKMGSGPDAERAGRAWLSSTEKQVESGTFVFLTSPDLSTRAHQVEVGRTFQRIALEATARGLAVHPMNAIPERRDREQTAGLADDFTTVLDELASAPVQLVLRMGVGTRSKLFHSPRRPVSWVTMG